MNIKKIFYNILMNSILSVDKRLTNSFINDLASKITIEDIINND